MGVGCGCGCMHVHLCTVSVTVRGASMSPGMGTALPLGACIQGCTQPAQDLTCVNTGSSCLQTKGSDGVQSLGLGMKAGAVLIALWLGLLIAVLVGGGPMRWAGCAHVLVCRERLMGRLACKGRMCQQGMELQGRRRRGAAHTESAAFRMGSASHELVASCMRAGAGADARLRPPNGGHAPGLV